MVRDADYCSDEALPSFTTKTAAVAADRQWYPRQALHMGSRLCPSWIKCCVLLPTYCVFIPFQFPTRIH